MGWETVAKCDVCGKIKGDANKWLLILTWIPPTLDSKAVPYFTIYFFSQTPPSGSKMVCGEECLHKLLNPFLGLRSKMVAPEEGHPAHVPEPPTIQSTSPATDLFIRRDPERIPVLPDQD